MSKKNKFVKEMDDLALLERATTRFLNSFKGVMLCPDFTDGAKLGLVHSLEGALEDWENKGGRI